MLDSATTHITPQQITPEPITLKPITLKQRQEIHKRVKTRFLFAAATWILYSSFVLGYGSARDIFVEKISSTSPISFALVYFVFLILTFLILEFIYLKIADIKPQEA